MIRVLRLLIPVAAVVYLVLSLGCGVVLMEGALHVARLPVDRKNSFAGIVAPWAVGGVADAEVTGADGALLKGWYAQPTVWNGDSVILLHGVGDTRQGVMYYAPMFLRAGYSVLLPDSRAHGESGGAVVTYGLLESEDVRRWSIWVASRARHTGDRRAACTFLFGESLGAAIALQATMAAQNVCAAVAEAPFSSFREIGYERIAQGLGSTVNFSHGIAWPMVNFAFLYAHLRYGLDFDEASPERKLAQSRVPALLITGLEDRNIPKRHSERILAFAEQGTQLWGVAGAGHTSAVSVGSSEFEQRVLGWFSTHSRRSE